MKKLLLLLIILVSTTFCAPTKETEEKKIYPVKLNEPFHKGLDFQLTDEEITFFHEIKMQNKKRDDFCTELSRFNRFPMSNNNWTNIHNEFYNCRRRLGKRLTQEQIYKLNSFCLNPFPPYLHPCEGCLNIARKKDEYAFITSLDIRLYNIVNKSNWAECPYEGDMEIDDLYNEPCNTTGEILLKCGKEKEVIKCMQQELIEKYLRYLSTPYHKECFKERFNIHLFFEKNGIQTFIENTYSLINTLVSDPKERFIELVGLYNFYDLTLDQVHAHAMDEIAKNPNLRCNP